MKKYLSHSPLETRRIAARLAHGFIPPAVIALQGGLGAGKTEFVKGLAHGLGIKRTIQSPTFVLHKSYPFKKNRRVGHLEHLDLYRLRKNADLAELDLQPLLADRDRIIVIEWPQTVKRRLPKKTFFIHFQHGQKPSQRIITLGSG